jgi:hypothetical protein
MLTTLFLNIAITLVFIYLVCAIMITAINEIFFISTRVRSRSLKKTIETLYFDKEWREMAHRLGQSPFISALKPKPNRFPQSIPAATFAMALLSEVSGGRLDLESIRKGVNAKTGKGELFTLLAALISQEGITFESLKKEVEQLFDGSMVRLAAWFKQYARVVSMVVGLVIAVTLNIDTIDITLNLWNNREQAEKLAAFATAASGQITQEESGRVMLNDAKGTLVIVDTKVVPPADTAGALRDDLSGELKTQVKQVLKSYNILVDLGIPMGWGGKNIPASGGTNPLYLLWILKIAGILLTAFAASLGAPFWYDLLSRVTPMKKNRDT